MASGVLTLLKDIHSNKQLEIERDYYNKCEEIEKRLAKEIGKFQEPTSKIKAATGGFAAGSTEYTLNSKNRSDYLKAKRSVRAELCT